MTIRDMIRASDRVNRGEQVYLLGLNEAKLTELADVLRDGATAAAACAACEGVTYNHSRLLWRVLGLRQGRRQRTTFRDDDDVDAAERVMSRPTGRLMAQLECEPADVRAMVLAGWRGA